MNDVKETELLQKLGESKLLSADQLQEIHNYAKQLKQITTPNNSLSTPASKKEDKNSDFEAISPISQWIQNQGYLTHFQLKSLEEDSPLQIGNFHLQERLHCFLASDWYLAKPLNQETFVRLGIISVNSLEIWEGLDHYLSRLNQLDDLTHPYLIKVHEKYVEGDSLFLVEPWEDSTHLDYLVNEMGALPATLACRYVYQLGLGIQNAHRLNILHGEISPDRIWLSPILRVPKKSDEKIQKRTESNNKNSLNSNNKTTIRPHPQSKPALEGMGLLPQMPALQDWAIGDAPQIPSLEYLAPERFVSSELTKEMDIYGLGACFYFLLAARPPYFGNSTEDLLMKIRHSDPIRIQRLRPDLPSELADLIHKMIEKNPANRPTDLQIVLEKLYPFLDDASIKQINEVQSAFHPSTSSVPDDSAYKTNPSNLTNQGASSNMDPHNIDASPHILPDNITLDSTPLFPEAEDLPLEKRTPTRENNHSENNSSHPKPIIQPLIEPIQIEEEEHNLFVNVNSGVDEKTGQPIQYVSREQTEVPSYYKHWKQWLLVGLFLNICGLTLLFTSGLLNNNRSPSRTETKESVKPKKKPHKTTPKND